MPKISIEKLNEVFQTDFASWDEITDTELLRMLCALYITLIEQKTGQPVQIFMCNTSGEAGS
jgi:hypothetical protein